MLQSLFLSLIQGSRTDNHCRDLFQLLNPVEALVEVECGHARELVIEKKQCRLFALDTVQIGKGFKAIAKSDNVICAFRLEQESKNLGVRGIVLNENNRLPGVLGFSLKGIHCVCTP